MKENEDFNILLCWKSESYISEYSDPDDFVYETSGELLNEDINGNRKLAGKFRTYYVNVERAINEKESIYNILDAHSSHLFEYFEPIFGSDAPDFNDCLLKILDHEVYSSNLLILDRLELLPQYRGKKLGLSLLRHMIDRFSSGAAVVAIKPFPLQFEVAQTGETEKEWQNQMSLGEHSLDESVATEKLCIYYSKLGFLRLDGTPMMVMSTEWSLPPFIDI